jgi:hypothetical protein
MLLFRQFILAFYKIQALEKNVDIAAYIRRIPVGLRVTCLCVISSAALACVTVDLYTYKTLLDYTIH